MKTFFDEIFIEISQCADKQILFDALNYDALRIIEDTLNAYFIGRIDIIEPRFDNGDPDLEGYFDLIIKNKGYAPNGYEKLILKWINDYECTDYLIECMRDIGE